MSKAELKKTLTRMSKEEIIGMVTEMYDVRPDVKEYLEYWLNPNADAELERRKEMVNDMHFFRSGKLRRAPTATEIKRVVKDFETLCYDPEKVADLLVYIADTCLRWVVYGLKTQAAPRKALERNIGIAREYVEKYDLEGVYGLRLDRMEEAMREYYNNPPEPPRRGRRRWYRW